ncbi:MAG: cysteine--tRNA ligase, partial [Trueperaceae bacterium]|nr:cysteine--tRNA ligase [Trueperaceae bacterium]
VPLTGVADAGEATETLSGVVELLLEQRQRARDRRDFPAADALRVRLEELGIEVEDTAAGSRWRLK